ncbi:alpha/beta hydrolase [Pseudonocardia spinosispora]|uniref:alpha/beta hydrolase n=1 Tax=Pseudonocardia spinosispora TaxID=103441 RepID=UPI000426525C|nr:alpha/beta hydrolase [Pseudonocardia spinosispora]
MTRPRTLLLLIVALLALTACASPQERETAGPHWVPCAPDPAAPLNPRQECTTVAVPLDHARPDGPRISLAVSRIRSESPRRRGVLILIPGGPGSTGLARPSTSLGRLPQQVADAYDLVGFDPRGLGASTPVSCRLAGNDMVPAVLKPWPAPDGDITDNVARARRVADACARNGGEMMRHLSTRTEAADIDRIREALGERRISYWGVSYGTYVGAVYATLFPDRTDRVVLDSNDDPNPDQVARGWLANYAISIEDRFPDFAAWAAARHGEYGLGADPATVRTTFLRVAGDLDRRPVPWPGAVPAELTGNGLRDVMLNSLYSDVGFPRLAALVHAVTTGTPLPQAPPVPPEYALQNSAAVLTATVCNDVGWPTDTSRYAAEVARNRAAFPLTAGMPANLFPCSFWPAAGPAVRVAVPDASTLLLVQNLRDPSTPHVGAVRMREALGDAARLVSVDSGGHGVYLANGNTCGDQAVTRFLVEGTRPDHDIVCGRDGGRHELNSRDRMVAPR